MKSSFRTGVDIMDYRVEVKSGVKYIECTEYKKLIKDENDALDLVSICGENDTQLLMLHSESLCDDFFRLRTCVAGNILQKFINYYIKVAAVIPEELVNHGRFREMALEANRRRDFHIFTSRDEAEEWLVKC
jgi:hypothetical protein